MTRVSLVRAFAGAIVVTGSSLATAYAARARSTTGSVSGTLRNEAGAERMDLAPLLPGIVITAVTVDGTAHGRLRFVRPGRDADRAAGIPYVLDGIPLGERVTVVGHRRVDPAATPPPGLSLSFRLLPVDVDGVARPSTYTLDAAHPSVTGADFVLQTLEIVPRSTHVARPPFRRAVGRNSAVRISSSDHRPTCRATAIRRDRVRRRETPGSS